MKEPCPRCGEHYDATLAAYSHAFPDTKICHHCATDEMQSLSFIANHNPRLKLASWVLKNSK